MRKNRIISTCLVMSLLLMTGCGDSVETVEEEVVVLREPQNADDGMNMEKVIRRNIYVASVYDAAIYPYIEEYSYATGKTFESYGAMLGDMVQEGDALIYAVNDSIESRIESMEEKINKLSTDYQEYKTKADETIAAAEWNVDYYQQILENLDEQKPDEYIIDANGNANQNPEYSSWLKEYRKWEGKLNYEDLTLSVAREELRQKKELYQLDYNYNNGLLRNMKTEQKEAVITAGISGEVVAIGMKVPGDYMGGETAVVAVGDMNRYEIRCEYVPMRNIVYYSKEVYAFVNGKRYDIVYVENGETDCTTFTFADENVNVKVGDYAVIVMETNSREQVVAVPKSALYVDSLGQYVYVVENGEPVRSNVKIGISDGTYTEIISGVEEGDMVLIPDTSREVIESAQVVNGDFKKEFSRSCSLMYPKQEYIYNPVEYGTIYFDECFVTRFSYVEAGEVLARIHVVGDEVELERLETNLQRSKERLNDLIAEDNEANEASIERQQESIAAQEEKITKMKADYATTEIVAKNAGIIMNVEEYHSGDKIAVGTKMFLVADASYGYLLLDDTGVLGYGDAVEVTYKLSNQEYKAQAEVKTIGSLGIPSSIRQDKLVAKVSDEVLDGVVLMLKNQTMFAGRYSMPRITASGSGKEMSNVLMVPKKAVTLKDNTTYVNVLQEDGSVLPVAFLAGGYDASYYWVIEGLTEGMTICWE